MTRFNREEIEAYARELAQDVDENKDPGFTKEEMLSFDDFDELLEKTAEQIVEALG